MQKSKPLFRASSCGNLLLSARSGHPSGLSQAGLRTVIKTFLARQYGIERFVTSKEMSKGIAAEEDALTLYSEVTGRAVYKNEKLYTDPELFLSGTPDAFIPRQKHIVEVKSPWDAETFMLADLTRDYEYQVRAYMMLTGAETADLAYVLTDLPPGSEVYADEYRRFCWNHGIMDDQSAEANNLIQAWERSVTFSQRTDIKPQDRVKIFSLTRDPEKEKKLLEGLQMAARVYSGLNLNTILTDMDPELWN